MTRPFLFRCAALMVLIASTAFLCAQGTNLTTVSLRRSPLTSAEREQIARSFAKSNKIDFAFEGADKLIRAETNGLRYFSRVSFFAVVDDRVFEVDIDPRGNVLSNSVGVAVCGLGMRNLRQTNAPIIPVPK